MRTKTGSVKILALLAALLAAPLAALCAGSEDWGTSGPFELGAGGRGIAMGGAAAAVWGDSYTLLWNPAGLYQVERSEADIFHTTLFDESTTYSSFFLSHSFLDIGVFSLGAVRLGIGGIERRDHENRIVAGELENTQTRYILGYARRIFRDLTGGVNVKLDRYVQDSYVANGFGLDAGFGYHADIGSPVVDGMAVGLSFRNLLEPAINLVSEEAGDPRAVRFGLSLWRSVSGRIDDRLLLAIDFDKTRYSEMHMHMGGEYSLRGLFSVRGGWDTGIPTFGCGFALKFFQIDYAYRSTDLGSNHLFSLTYRFGASRADRLVARRVRREKEIRTEIDAQVDRYEDRFVTSSLIRGQESLENGDFGAALEYFQGVLLWSPENEQARHGARVAGGSMLVAEGDSLMNLERYTDALFSYRKAYKQLPQPVIGKRIEECETLIAETSNRQDIITGILRRSIELYTERTWYEAESGFTKVLELEPGHELAADYLQRTQKRIRDVYEGMISRADRLAEEKRYASALEQLRKGLDRHPGDSGIEQRIERVIAAQEAHAAAQSLQRTADPARRVSISQTELETLRSPYERGVEYFKGGNFAGAIGQWEQVWKRHPQYEKVAEYLVKAYQYMGMELYARHRYKECLEVWGKILDVDPDNEKALRYIERTREELAKLEGISG